MWYDAKEKVNGKSTNYIILILSSPPSSFSNRTAETGVEAVGEEFVGGAVGAIRRNIDWNSEGRGIREIWFGVFKVLAIYMYI